MKVDCLFCSRPLGAKEVIAAYPVGRRRAFDSAKGRLWVVCRHCERCNLTPLDLRWEAVEQCERWFRETRVRMSTDQIGLARLREGLELVRIGEPLRPEFAAWRYGDQFGRRRKRAIAWGIAGGAAIVAVAGGMIAAGVGVSIAPQLPSILMGARVVARVRRADGKLVKVRGSHLPGARLLEPGSAGGPWSLQVKHDRGKTLFEGEDAVAVAGVLLPAVNRYGARANKVQEAVQTLEAAGGPEGFLAHGPSALAALYGANLRGRPARLDKLSVPTRLALEMALHEEQERRALAGELLTLEAAWREAEEVAAIADGLLVPEEVRGQLDRLRSGKAGEV